MTNHAHILLRRSEIGLSGFMRRSGDRELSDDRILGSGEFVERIIKEADAKIKYQLPVKEQAQKIGEFNSQIM